MQGDSMGSVLIILWLPITIAFMAVAFVVTLGATGGSVVVESASLPRTDTGGSGGGAQ
jgi:hypothetical protein